MDAKTQQPVQRGSSGSSDLFSAPRRSQNGASSTGTRASAQFLPSFDFPFYPAATRKIYGRWVPSVNDEPQGLVR